MKVLWLDDDTRAGLVRNIDGFEVRCAQTCAEADTMLLSVKPDILIVDLVVPQGGWRGDRLLNTPGLNFMGHVSKFKDRPKIVAYAFGLRKTTRKAAQDSGADAVYDKTHISFIDMLRTVGVPAAGAAGQ